MALRVLLADESSTIKKVMELALQDFAVTVKAVPVGLDVLAVAKSFKPDIVFADVMLQKKNGYEVCAELKADAMLKHVPVILMWSGFMEFDDKKSSAAHADNKLEKPFDAETLRGLVKGLVPAVQDNAISNFLSFPNLPAIEEGPAPTGMMPSTPVDVKPGIPSGLPKAPIAPPAPATTPNTSLPAFDLSTDDDHDEFQQVPLKSPASSSVKSTQLEPQVPEYEGLSLEEIDITKTNISLSSGEDDITLDQVDKLTDLGPIKSPRFPLNEGAGQPASQKVSGSSSLTGIDPQHLEQLLRQQVRDVLQDVAWKVLPDIAERIIREEIQRLLKDAEKI